MRTIQISTEVFAAIWKEHRPGDVSEDEILRRKFKLPAQTSSVPTASTAPVAVSTSISPASQAHVGIEDKRNGVKLEENFEIFRSYKGTQFRARATGGEWLLLNDNSRHPSLHKLSWHVIKGPENAWYGWKYLGKDGKNHYVHTLRAK
jgi:hypothetical protein